MGLLNLLGSWVVCRRSGIVPWATCGVAADRSDTRGRGCYRYDGDSRQSFDGVQVMMRDCGEREKFGCNDVDVQ